MEQVSTQTCEAYEGPILDSLAHLPVSLMHFDTFSEPLLTLTLTPRIDLSNISEMDRQLIQAVHISDQSLANPNSFITLSQAFSNLRVIQVIPSFNRFVFETYNPLELQSRYQSFTKQYPHIQVLLGKLLPEEAGRRALFSDLEYQARSHIFLNMLEERGDDFIFMLRQWQQYRKFPQAAVALEYFCPGLTLTPEQLYDTNSSLEIILLSHTSLLCIADGLNISAGDLQKAATNPFIKDRCFSEITQFISSIRTILQFEIPSEPVLYRDVLEIVSSVLKISSSISPNAPYDTLEQLHMLIQAINSSVRIFNIRPSLEQIGAVIEMGYCLVQRRLQHFNSWCQGSNPALERKLQIAIERASTKKALAEMQRQYAVDCSSPPPELPKYGKQHHSMIVWYLLTIFEQQHPERFRELERKYPGSLRVMQLYYQLGEERYNKRFSLAKIGQELKIEKGEVGYIINRALKYLGINPMLKYLKNTNDIRSLQ